MKKKYEMIKEIAVQKYLNRGSRTVAEICKEMGISRATLYDWSRAYAKSRDGHLKTGDHRPKTWKPVERLRAVSEFLDLKEENKGEYLKKSGLLKETMDLWRQEIEAGYLQFKALDAKKGSKKNHVEGRELREVKIKLARMEQALAEAAALLVLKKKLTQSGGTGKINHP